MRPGYERRLPKAKPKNLIGDLFRGRDTSRRVRLCHYLWACRCLSRRLIGQGAWLQRRLKTGLGANCPQMYPMRGTDADVPVCRERSTIGAIFAVLKSKYPSVTDLCALPDDAD